MYKCYQLWVLVNSFMEITSLKGVVFFFFFQTRLAHSVLLGEPLERGIVSQEAPQYLSGY